MPQSVSVPEKTLEHWSSQYITYRYRSKAALWWPASGEDIDVRWLPARRGKAVQIELKTTTVVRPWVHDVLVDLGQLWEYRQRPLGHQPFYVFPRPDWDGSLTAVTMAANRAVTELGFARSGAGWWFADWMDVLTAARVAAVLHHELAAHASKNRGEKGRLVRYDWNNRTPAGLPSTTWGPSGSLSPGVVGWREFWPELEQCGRLGWPQLIRLPARIVRARSPYRPLDIVGLLREAADMRLTDREEPLVTLEPDADGNYQIELSTAGNLSGSDDDENNVDGAEDSDHRQIVFLDARVLLPKT
jgi:hypothetical protein